MKSKNGHLGSTIQSPLDLKEWIHETLEKTFGLAKEQKDEQTADFSWLDNGRGCAGYRHFHYNH